MKNKEQTSKSFGEKWLTEEGKNYGTSKSDVLEQFLPLFGIHEEKDLYDIFKDGMNCLDAGCGVGWAEELFNINENVTRYAVDISDSVEIAKERTKHMNNVIVLKADLGSLPFDKEFFDIIFSNGVLHHTGNTEKYFSKLCYHLKPNGLIGVYIYCKKPLIRSLADEHIRNNTTLLSFDECLDFSESISKLGKSLQKIKEGIVIEEDIPLLGIKKGTYGMQEFIYNHFLKCYYNDNMGLDGSTLVNVDWYHPSIVTFHTLEEILTWFGNNNIKDDIKVLQPEGWEHSGWFISGRKI